MEVHVRTASAADAEVWRGLFASVAGEGRWIGAEAPVDDFAPAMFEHHLGATGSLLLIAEADGAAVGWITAELHEARIAELGMGIIDGYRGQGIGTVMMDAVLDWATTAHVDRLRLDVFPHNTAAIALYHRFGFVEIEHRPAAWPRRNGERWDLVTMERTLSAEEPAALERDAAGRLGRVSWRRERVRRQLGGFMRQYQRKASHGMDPNDRSYDRRIEQQIKRMSPAELDRLLREDEDDA